MYVDFFNKSILYINLDKSSLCIPVDIIIRQIHPMSLCSEIKSMKIPLFIIFNYHKVNCE